MMKVAALASESLKIRRPNWTVKSFVSGRSVSSRVTESKKPPSTPTLKATESILTKLQKGSPSEVGAPASSKYPRWTRALVAKLVPFSSKKELVCPAKLFCILMDNVAP